MLCLAKLAQASPQSVLHHRASCGKLQQGENGSLRKRQTSPACNITLYILESCSPYLLPILAGASPPLDPMVPGLFLCGHSSTLVAATWQELLHGKVFHCAGTECGTCKQYWVSSETNQISSSPKRYLGDTEEILYSKVLSNEIIERH